MPRALWTAEGARATIDRVRLGVLALILAACGGATPDRAVTAEPEPPPPEPPPPPPLVVTVLAYNVWFLPPVARDIPERAALMSRHLAGYDVVVLSEAFDDAARATVVAAMEARGYAATPVLGTGQNVECTRSLGPIEVAVDLDMNGGVVVLGRHRLERWEQRIFSPVCAGEDCCAAKGVMYARFRTEEDLCLHVLGTHLQNQDPVISWGSPRDMRGAQLGIVRAFADEQLARDPCPGPVIIAGDLNLGERDLPQAAVLLRARAPGHRDGPRSYGEHASYVQGARPVQLDWVLATDDYDPPVYSVMETRLFRERHPVTGSGMIAVTSEEVADLSDHHAVAGHFEWRTPVTAQRIWAGADRACEPILGTDRGRPGWRLCFDPPLLPQGLQYTECDTGLDSGPCADARPPRCIQVVDPRNDDPAGFDDYLCYGQ